MTDMNRRRASECERIVTALGELIEALDRRVPHVERLGEVRIAREAAALRTAAIARIEALKRASPDRQTREDELSDAVMADDGSPRDAEGR
jgi:hypothetical protein